VQNYNIFSLTENIFSKMMYINKVAGANKEHPTPASLSFIVSRHNQMPDKVYT
jgi:hypothetical protein